MKKLLAIILVTSITTACSQHYCPTYGKKDRYANFKR